MNPVAKEIQTGLTIIRKEGINFSNFKSMVSPLLTPTPKWNDDFWIMIYESYAWCRGTNKSTYFESVEEWAKEFFQEYNLNEHSCKLK